MTKKLAERLCEESEGSIYEGYSGRGMYGNETTAVEFDSLHDFRRALIHVAYQLGIEDDDDDASVLQELIDLSLDNMGRGFIAY